MKKNFIIDTNVLLHDHQSIFNFQENDIYIPIVVLEELDKFKVGNAQINYNARRFMREMNALASAEIFSKGAPLGEGKGRLFVFTDNTYPEAVEKSFVEKIPDHRIIAATYILKNKYKDTKTILVSKDINMRMKAMSLGLDAEDYTNDKVTDENVTDKTCKTYEDIDNEVINTMYANKAAIDVSEFEFADSLLPNECFILKNSRSSVLARFNPFENVVQRVDKHRCFGIEPRNAEQTFAMEVLLDPEIKLVALTGKSGTGKTLLAFVAALQQYEQYKQILLARPIVALGNKDLGYLPGDEKNKISPYMQPLFDNLNVIKSALSYQGREIRIIDELQRNNALVIEALAFIRGRSLSETFFIVDEAQNLTPHEIKTIVTRAGEGTKIVLTGDIEQIDSPYLDRYSNGVVYLIDKMNGQKLFTHINLIKGERSELSEIASRLL